MNTLERFYVKQPEQKASEPFLEIFQSFAALDIDYFPVDFEALEINYSLHIVRYMRLLREEYLLRVDAE